jgi:glycosyltransferase involved in cell wall biosynthesis
MRVLWSSNSPFIGTGYGCQTATAARHLKDMGHDVAIFAFYGLQGSKIDWGDIPIYPNNPQDWGIKHSPMFYKDWKADVLITLVDAWVLGQLNPELNWVPWLPVDHDPVPSAVVKALKNALGLVKPIAMSKFGQAQLKNFGIDAYYIPHSVNCEIFTPNPDWRKESRERYHWEDKFVIGCVATNHQERKNWLRSLQAVKIFDKMHPGEVIFYMHTNPMDERGIDLLGLRNTLEIEDITKFPSQSEMVVGIPTDTMARMYNCLDVFLLPTKGEGFGIPLIEAMACGVPCITTNCTAQTEIMENAGGWLIKDLKPQWTLQSSWQFDCTAEEIVECLERAYQAKKNGTMINHRTLARSKALEYDDKVIFRDYWPPVLADIEKRIKQPKNLEGVQQWRRAFIPKVALPRKVLDIGCGLTTPYYDILRALGDYVGVDNRFENNMVGEGKALIKADACDLPFKDGEFGFVWMSEVLEHLDNPEKAIAEAKRVGKHGVCLFSTPSVSSFKIDPSHKVVKMPYAVVATGDGLIVW